MLRCSRCQFDNPGDALFCSECGSRLTAHDPPPKIMSVRDPRSDGQAAAASPSAAGTVGKFAVAGGKNAVASSDPVTTQTRQPAVARLSVDPPALPRTQEFQGEYLGSTVFASFADRLGAQLLDLFHTARLALVPALIFAGIAAALLRSAYYQLTWFGAPVASWRAFDDSDVIIGAVIAGLATWGVVWCGYVWIGNCTGSTWGKRTVGLRIAVSDGRPPGFIRGTWRMMCQMAIGLSFLLYGAGLVLVLIFNRKGQRLHDMLAGTFVVKAVPPKGA